MTIINVSKMLLFTYLSSSGPKDIASVTSVLFCLVISFVTGLPECSSSGSWPERSRSVREGALGYQQGEHPSGCSRYTQQYTLNQIYLFFVNERGQMKMARHLS